MVGVVTDMLRPFGAPRRPRRPTARHHAGPRDLRPRRL